MIDKEILYSLDDISVIPAVSSDVRSRKECNPFTYSLEGKENYLPIITAPMDSVVDDTCYKKFWDSGISAIIPRTVDLEIRFRLCEEVFCAFGFDEIEKEFISKTKEGDNLYILIDVANGHMNYQIELGKKLKDKYGDKLKLMGGNIANPETYKLYDEVGFDYLRCGVGGGAGCITSVNCSIHHPMASLIEKTRDVMTKIGGKTKIIADGGIKTYSDAIKCLVLGADYVMMGYTLSKCLESAGDFYDYNYQKISKETAQKFLETNQKVYKDYHGMSTKKVQAKILGVDEKKERHNLKTSEGRSEFTRIEYTLPGWTENFNSYLRSMMSYVGVRKVSDLKKANCQVISKSSQEKLRK